MYNIYRDEDKKLLLDTAQEYAERHSTCCKVKVGSVIVTRGGSRIYGCNHGVHNCKENGCRRLMLYGEAGKNHRLPSDCDAMHSEIDAISKAACLGIPLEFATICVTRYPCENCARAIAASGIKHVVYGRKEDISSYTSQILSAEGVTTEKLDWEREDNNE